MSQSIHCASCQADIEAEASFCAVCGTPVHRCRHCNAAVLETDAFCGQCGRPVADPIRSTPAPRHGSAPLRSPWDHIFERLRAVTEGEFEIIREVGRGGFAAVYLARQFGLNRHVAIKVMSPELMATPGMYERFRREGETVARLIHPHVITIHDVRLLDGLHFLVMQFVEGRALDVILARTPRLRVPVIRAILYQVATALLHAHRRGVVHRDVKPGNILVSVEGNAIVTDFGIAKVTEGGTSTTTKTGATMGTVPYMSPEQCYARAVGAASDQYSLGIVAYEMLTGQPPFLGTQFEIMMGHTRQDPPDPRLVRADCPADLAEVVLQMLAKDGEARFPTLAEAIQALGAGPLGDVDPVRDEIARMAGFEEAVGGGPAPMPPPEPVRIVTPRRFTPVPSPDPSVPPVESAPEPSAAPAGPTTPGTGYQFVDFATPTALDPAPVPEPSTEPRVTPPDRADPPWYRTRAVSAAAAVGIVAVLAAVVVFSSDEAGTQPPDLADTLLLEPRPDTGERRAADPPPPPPPTGTPAGDAVPVPVPVTASARITTRRLSLEIGARQGLRVELRDQSGRPVADRSRPVAWASSNPDVAAVDPATGAVTARAEGTATIRVRAGEFGDEIPVIVSLPPGVGAVAVAGIPDSLVVRRTGQATATVRDRAGRPMSRGGDPVAWASSNPAVATVGPAGLVTAVSAGRTTITATVSGVRGGADLVVVEPASPPSPLPVVEPVPPPAPVVPAEAEMAPEVDRVMALITANDLEAMTALYPGADGDRQRQRFLGFVKDKYSPRSGSRSIGPARVAGDGAVADVTVNFEWIPDFGGRLNRTAQFTVSFERRGGRWRAATVRLLAPFP